MSELSLTSLKQTNICRIRNNEKSLENKKKLMILVNSYLIENGYVNTLREFENEAYLNFDEYEKSNEKNPRKRISLNSSRPNSKSSNVPREKPESGDKIIDLTMEGRKIETDSNIESEERILPPLDNSFQGEFRELAQIICREIMTKNLNVCWNSIVGLESAKRCVKEAVIYPIKYPSIFKGILKPWKGLLLYGPPGNGKTLLAKAVATECNTTFFNISASTIVSKWRGESEKLIKVLFDLARFYAPSTIFIDELDSIMSHRTSSASSTEHEGSRRMKTELLIQLDGLAKTSEMVFLLAASNIPWDLDMAMMRRLEKRIFVDLPDLRAREIMLENFLNMDKKESLIRSMVDYQKIASMTEGYSGADLMLLCRESAMMKIRKIFKLLEDEKSTKLDKILCDKIQLEPIETKDLEVTLLSTKPSNENLSKRYKEFEIKFSSV